MIQKWHERFLASFEKRLELHDKGKRPETLEAPRVEEDAGRPAAPAAVADEPARSVEPPPAAEPTPQATQAELAQPDLPPSSPTEPVEPPPPEPPVLLPWPWSLANPADVPEEVWQRARAAQRKE
jgi:hypothetical protein